MIGFGSSSEDDVRDYAQRFKLFYIYIGIVAIALTSRLWYLQIVEGHELRQYSEKNRIKENRIPAPRGLVLDRNGEILIDNTLGFNATISPQYATRLQETAEDLGKALDLDPSRIVNMVQQSRRRNGPFMPVRIKDNLSLDEVYKVKALRIENPGLDVEESILRAYPLGENGAQLLGYVGEISRSQLESMNRNLSIGERLRQGDIIGQSGLEQVWDSELRGKDGLSYIEVDAHGRESPTEAPAFVDLRPQPAIPGNDLKLTIDKDIQRAAHKAMLEQNDRIGPRIGATVAMKSNGEILAWVVSPSFDPNKFARGISSEVWSRLVNDPFKPLRNKPIQDHYSPGSTIKPFVALAALQEEAITRTTLLHSPGVLRYGGRPYHDSYRPGHGNIDVFRALEVSSNVFFYRLGIQLGIDTIAQYAQFMGLGLRTNINLRNEVSGTFPTREWKLRTQGEPWQPGENLSNAIGQGFVSTTLLQLALGYNAIGLEGPLMLPLIVTGVTNSEGDVVKTFEPEMVRDLTEPNEDGVVINKEHMKTVKEGLRRVANGDRGTARWWRIPGVEMAGKTGTTQLVALSATEVYERCDERPIHLRHHGTYIGYAPADEPLITVATFAEHACHGSTGAAPIVRDVIRAYIEKYHPEKIRRPRTQARQQVATQEISTEEAQDVTE